MPLLFPGCNDRRQGIPISNAAVEPLALEHRAFNFGHIQPPPMLRRVPKLQPIHDPAGFGRRTRGVERGRWMGMQSIQDHTDQRSRWEMDVNEVAHVGGKILLGSLVCDRAMPPAGQRLDHDKEVRGSGPAIRIVDSAWLARRERYRNLRFGDQLNRTFIKTDHWIGGSV